MSNFVYWGCLIGMGGIVSISILQCQRGRRPVFAWFAVGLLALASQLFMVFLGKP